MRWLMELLQQLQTLMFRSCWENADQVIEIAQEYAAEAFEFIASFW
jgi:hypothetical protein